MNSLQQIVEGLRRERDEVVEANNELKRNLEMVDMQYREMEVECQRYV